LVLPALKLRRLQAVQAIYQYRSALKAADHVHMSQPAVTGALAALERDIGARLFERTSRGMVPTGAGEAFCARITSAFAYLKSAEAMIGQVRKSGTPLHRLISEGQLRALGAVIEAGSFSEAGRRLGLSQPSIHRAVRELETLCGVALFRRHSAGLEASFEGRELSRYGALCMAELAIGLDELKEIEGVIEGNITIGALPLARSQWLPQAMARTLEAFPKARFSIIDGPYEEQWHGLMHGRIDMILGALREPAKDIEQIFLFDDPLVIVVRADHPFARDFDSAADKLTSDQLGSLSWILPRQGTPARRNFEAFMSTKGLSAPSQVVECSSLVATRALLLETDHAALLSVRQIGLERDLSLLKVMGPPLTGSSRPIGITLRKAFRPTQLHKHVLEALKAAANPPATNV
jgi:LysR family transcriptional regulator, regulator for genes of the gallate degradation pathway